MSLYQMKEFLNLSAEINYQLDARVGSLENVLVTVLGDRTLSEADQSVLLATLEYLERAYEKKERRLGPRAILHPLRATALLVRAEGRVDLLDVLVELLHDKFEDILPEGFEPAAWQQLEEQFAALVQSIDNETRWYLMERLEQLTRRKQQETYYRYIGRLLSRAAQTPQLVKIKLADRLDNTLDVRVDSRGPFEEDSFYGGLFQLLFSPHFPGFRAGTPHPPRGSLHGARRLYELFKNTVVLSLLRQQPPRADDHVARELFAAIARAGAHEAQRILAHIFAYHYRDLAQQRRLVLETMEYCFSGGLEKVTPVNPTNRLDGLFMERFDSASSEERMRKLEVLYDDKELMSAAAIAFMVIFLSFLSDETYYVRGVSAEGIHA